MNFKKITILLLGTALSVSALTAQSISLGTDFVWSGLVEYDENGNKIHEQNDYSDCYYEYDADNHLIHSTISDEYENAEYWFTYDDKGRLFGQRFEGGECWYEYDEQNHQIIQHGNGDSNWIYDCDENWNKLHGNNGTIELWYKYDSNGNVIYFEDYSDFYIKYYYDSNNHLVKKDENNDFITYYEYDSNGNLIRETLEYFPEKWYAYTYWYNGKIKSQIQFSLKGLE